jgi:ABC-type Fe3+-hydroxamate transport system substrate-binding protein
MPRSRQDRTSRPSSVQRSLLGDVQRCLGWLARALAIFAGLLFAGLAHAQPTSSPTPIPTPTRIAALAPSLTELVFAAGAGDKLVAVSTYSDFPEAAKKIPQVSAYAGVNIESLLSHKPDLVLVWPTGTRESDIASMRRLGMRVEAIGVNGLDDVPDAIRKVGALVGTQASAERVAQAIEARIATLEKQILRSARATPLRVFIELGRLPLTSVNEKHFASDLVKRCGGVNIFADAQQLVFEPSRELLLRKNPQAILRSTSSRNENAQRSDFSLYAGTRAAASRTAIVVDADHLWRPGPRLIDAAESICAQSSRIAMP